MPSHPFSPERSVSVKGFILKRAFRKAGNFMKDVVGSITDRIPVSFVCSKCGTYNRTPRGSRVCVKCGCKVKG